MKTFPLSRTSYGHPEVSCFGLNRAEIARRRPAQHAPKAEPGQYPLWHDDFDTDLYVEVCDASLFRLTADLPRWLRRRNGERELDFYDYGYVADLLRERLAGETRPNAVLSLSRALAWAEETGKRVWVIHPDSLTRRP